MIEAGTVQNGLKLISMILAFMIGDCRSILPTPAAWRVTTRPSSTVSTSGGRDVHDHVAVAEIARIGAQAHDVELELAQADLGRDVHGRDRRGVERAGGVEAVAGLEAAHAGLDIGIVDRRIAGRRVEVAGLDQALAQRQHAPGSSRRRACVAGPDRLPAAAGDDVAIALDHLLGRGERLRRKGSASSSAARGCGTRRRSSAATRPGRRLQRTPAPKPLARRSERAQRTGEERSAKFQRSRSSQKLLFLNADAAAEADPDSAPFSLESAQARLTNHEQSGHFVAVDHGGSKARAVGGRMAPQPGQHGRDESREASQR